MIFLLVFHLFVERDGGSYVLSANEEAGNENNPSIGKEIEITGIVPDGKYKKDTINIGYRFLGDYDSNIEFFYEEGENKVNLQKDAVVQTVTVSGAGEHSIIFKAKEKNSETILIEKEVRFFLGVPENIQVSATPIITKERVNVKYQTDVLDVCINGKIVKDGMKEAAYSVKKPEGVYQAEEEFVEEGKYVLEYYTKDETDVKRLEFTIDKKNPEISLEEQTAIVSNKKVKHLIFTATEAATGELTVQKSLDDNRVEEEKKMLRFTKDTLRQVVTYSEDGEYTYELTVKDDAENSSNLLKGTIVIDYTKPVLCFDGIEDGKVYRDGQSLCLSVKEKNHKKEEYKLVVQKEYGDGTVTKETMQLNPEKWTNSGENMISQEVDFSEEAKYEIIFVGTDSLGNQADEKRISFEIDQTAPEIVLNTTIDNNEIYNEDVDFKFSIVELNYHNVDAKVEIKRTLDGVTTTDVCENLQLVSKTSLFSYLLEKDGKYEIKVIAKDKVLGEQAEKIWNLEMDQAKPTIHILGVKQNQRVKDQVKIKAQIQDRNHDFSGYTLLVKKRNLNNEEEMWEVNDEGAWKKDGYIVGNHTSYLTEREFEFTQEGNYEVALVAKDCADNVEGTKKYKFTIDRSAPTIFGVSYSNADGLLQLNHGIIYSNKTIKVDFQVDDFLSKINDEKIYVTKGQPDEKKQDTPIYIAKKVSAYRYSVYVPLNQNQLECDQVVTIWANDELGNESKFTTSRMIYNQVYPNISIECDGESENWTNKNLVFRTTVSDDKSGIKEVKYTVNGKEIKRVKFDTRIQSYISDIEVKDDSKNANGYALKIEVINNCGLKNVKMRQIYIDKTKPKVTLEGVTNGEYYNENQVIEAKVEDVSYKGTKTKFVVKRTLDGNTYDVKFPVLTMDRDKKTKKYKLKKEGKYKVYAITEDAAGNKKKSNTLSFVIDKTAPKLDISGVREESINAHALNLEFLSEESFYETNDISIQMTKKIDGSTTQRDITDFQSNQKKSTMHYSISEDGEYEVRISATDQAGNIATPKTMRFTLDSTKPEIHIIGSDNYQLWSDPVSLQFKVLESFYMKNRVKIEGTMINIEGEEKKLDISPFANMDKSSVLNQTFDKDGIYHLMISAEDAAGNYDQKEIHFTIDQTKPEIKNMKELDGKYYKEFQLPKNQEEIFKDLTVVTYHMLLNGIEYNGTDKITEEGKYNLSIDVVDELNHKANVMIEFIIDHTKPKILLTGVPESYMVKNSGEIQIDLADKEDKIRSVKLNGTELGAEVKTISYTEYGTYKIEIESVDRAGNVATKTISFMYTSPYILPIIIMSGIVMLFTVTLLLIMYKRKKARRD